MRCTATPEHGRVVRLLALSMLVVVTLLASPGARAATVVLVRPANASPAMAETLVRIHGELMSVGFGVEMVDASEAGGGAGPDSLGRLAEQRGADAVVAIVGDPSGNRAARVGSPASDTRADAVDVWVVDQVTGKSVMRRLPGSESAPETLAIRAIELLRSSFLEIELGPHSEGQAGPPSPAVIRFVQGPAIPAQPAQRLGVSLGAAVLLGTDGLGATLAPELGLDFVWSPELVLRLSTAGFGTRPTVTSASGSARVAQQYAVLGAEYRLRPARRLRPFIGLSAGALHTAVEGQADTGQQSASSQQWSGLADVGLGAWIALNGRFHLALGGHVQLAEPYLGIRFVDKVAATSGRPNLVLTMTVGAWL